MDSLFDTYKGEEAGVGLYEFDHSFFEPVIKEIRLRLMKAKVLGFHIAGIVVADWFATVLRLELSSSGDLHSGPLFIRSDLLDQDIPVRSVSVSVQQTQFGDDPVFRLEAA